LGLLLFGFAGVGVVALILRYGQKPAEPPMPNLARLDPAVVAAIEAGQDDVRKAPRDANKWAFLGKVFYTIAYFDEASACFRQASRLESREPRWPYFVGVSLELVDPVAALVEMRRSVALLGDEAVPQRLRLANLLLAQGQVDEAEGYFQTILKQEPDNAPAHLGLARVAAERNDVPASLKHLPRCLSSPLTAKPARVLRAELYHRSGDSKAAERERRLASYLPEPLPPLDVLIEDLHSLRVGRVATLNHVFRLFQEGKAYEAMALLDQTVRQYPESGAVWLALGRAQLGQNEPQQAERSLRMALAKEPGMVDGSLSLGQALLAQGRTEEAAKQFRHAIKLRPNDAEAHSNLAHCLRLQGKRAEAIRAYQAVLRYRPYNAHAHAQLGELLKQEGDAAKALEHLELAASFEREEKEAREGLHFDRR
jgi:tetratricopeptide (TPR) repeat protein